MTTLWLIVAVLFGLAALVVVVACWCAMQQIKREDEFEDLHQ